LAARWISGGAGGQPPGITRKPVSVRRSQVDDEYAGAVQARRALASTGPGELIGAEMPDRAQQSRPLVRRPAL